MLVLTNVMLPKTLGIEKFARLSEFIGYVALTTAIFHEGVTLLTIERINRASTARGERARVVWQSACENVALVGVLVLVVGGASSMIWAGHHYAAGDWVQLGLTAFVVAAYTPCLAWLVARRQNEVVAALAVVHGASSVGTALLLDAVQSDIRWSVGCSYALCLGISATKIFMSERWKRPGWRASVAPICLRPAIVGASAPSLMMVGLQSVPVVMLTATNQLELAVAYKLGMALAAAVVTLAPLSRRSLLAVVDHINQQQVTRLAGVWVLGAGIGGAFVASVGPELVHVIYGRGFEELARIIPALTYFAVVQVVADYLMVGTIHRGLTRILIAASAGASGALIAALLIAPVHWVPVLTVAAFASCIYALDRESRKEASLALYACSLGLAACALAEVNDPILQVVAQIVVLSIGTALKAELREGVALVLKKVLRLVR